MTDKEKDLRIMLLEDALLQAQHTISFMHGCLTEPKHYKYAYPELTEQRFEEFRKLYNEDDRKPCYHSMIKNDCPSCVSFVTRQQLKKQLKEEIEIELKTKDNEKNKYNYPDLGEISTAC